MGLFDELLREIGREMLGLPDKPAPRRRQRPDQPKEPQPDRQRQSRAERRAEKAAAAPRQDAPHRHLNVTPALPAATDEPEWSTSETILAENSLAAIAQSEMNESARSVAKKAGRAAQAAKPATSGAKLAQRLAHNPHAAREAFIFAEILSPPLALRGDGTQGQAGSR